MCPSHAVNLVFELRKLIVQEAALHIRVSVVGSLHRQLADTKQHGGHVLRSPLSCLNHGNSIACISNALVQAFNLLRHSSGNGQACCIVFGGVNALAR